MDELPKPDLSPSTVQSDTNSTEPKPSFRHLDPFERPEDMLTFSRLLKEAKDRLKNNSSTTPDKS